MTKISSLPIVSLILLYHTNTQLANYRFGPIVRGLIMRLEKQPMQAKHNVPKTNLNIAHNDWSLGKKT